MSHTVMTVTTEKTDAIIKNIGSYMVDQYRFKNKGEYCHHRIFRQSRDNIYVYMDEKEPGIIIRLFIHHYAWGDFQISRRFSWLTLGIYSDHIAKICREINSVILELDASAQIQIEDKEEWYPVIILK